MKMNEKKNMKAVVAYVAKMLEAFEVVSREGPNPRGAAGVKRATAQAIGAFIDECAAEANRTSKKKV